MPTMQNQLDRIKANLLDTDDTSRAFGDSLILLQHQHELIRLARERLVGDIRVITGVIDQSFYALPAHTAGVEIILYNGRRLDFATEEFLDRKYAIWEFQRNEEPKYWTTDNQNPNNLRIVPAPLRSGSSALTIPASPLVQSYVDNFIVFLYRDVSGDADGAEADLPVLDVWEDVLVWRTTGELARREGPYQNLPVSNLAYTLADLWLESL